MLRPIFLFVRAVVEGFNLSDCIRKINRPGHAYCLYCDKQINYTFQPSRIASAFGIAEVNQKNCGEKSAEVVIAW